MTDDLNHLLREFTCLALHLEILYECCVSVREISIYYWSDFRIFKMTYIEHDIFSIREDRFKDQKSLIGNSIYTILFTLTHVTATHQIYTVTLKPQV